MDSDPSDSAVESDEPAPVFLVGFPRSGTTLLDEIWTAFQAFKSWRNGR